MLSLSLLMLVRESDTSLCKTLASKSRPDTQPYRGRRTAENIPCSARQNPSCYLSQFTSNLSLSNPIFTILSISITITISLYMELFQELLFTLGVYLLVCVVFPKLVSMAISSSDVAKAKSVLVSADLIEKRVMNEPEHNKKSVVCDLERVSFVEEVFECDELEEKEFRVETFRSPVIYDDSEIADNERVGVVGLEEKSVEESVCKEEVKEGEVDSGELKEDTFIVVEDEFEENLVGKSPERAEFGETGIELGKDEVGVYKSEEIGVLESEGTMGTESDEVGKIEIELGKDEMGVAESDEVLVLESGDSKQNETDGVNNNVADDEEGLFDDWEGIERTELEKCFGAAMVFVDSKTNANCISSLDNDTKMQLYGLHKVAIEGPCHEPQPMALKVSARAKW